MYDLKTTDNGYYICNVRNDYGLNRDYVLVDVKPKESNSNDETNNSNNNNRNENEEQSNENANQNLDSTTTAPVNVKKPLVLIKPLTNGRQIQVGQELKIACLVSGNLFFFLSRYQAYRL